MKFTAHNVSLAGDKRTVDNKRALLCNTPLWLAIKKTITQFIPNESARKNMRAVDLGCMEGGYSLELANLGFDTLGIDARRSNLVKANYIKHSLNKPNLNFVLDDVQHIAKYGVFDVTLCLGLIYHLNNPADFLKKIHHQTGRMLVLHTFYAPGNDLSYDLQSLYHRFSKLFQRKKTAKTWTIPKGEENSFIPFVQHKKNYRLSRLADHEGYKGRWFHEWGAATPANMIEDMASASYSNHNSFWFCKNDMINALYNAGFTTVYEQLDGTQPADDYYGRMLLVALV